MADHPIRTAAATESGVVEDTLLEQMVKRYGISLGATESLGDIDQDTGEIALCVSHAGTGYVYFYDDSDTTTLDDGLYTLVDGSGHRYHIQDSASITLNSVLSRTNTPPGSPTVGDTYIVGTSPTGAWASNANDVAVYTVRGWIFASPSIGLSLYNQDDSSFWLYDETPAWVSSNPLVVADGAAISDVNGNELLVFGVAASAVNNLKIKNAATGNSPSLEAQGDDSNVDVLIVPKGTGKLATPWFKFPNEDGDPGQTMVTDGNGIMSWGSAGGRKRLAEKTASNDSVLDFTEFNNSIYDVYEFTLYEVYPVGNADFQMRMSANGGSSYSAGSTSYDAYSNELIFQTNGGYRLQTNHLRLSGNNDVLASGDNGVCGTIRIVGAPDSGARTHVYFNLSFFEDSGSQFALMNGVGFRTSSVITDGIRFLFDSTNISSGTIALDGIRSS